jgi:hypothetical protein
LHRRGGRSFREVGEEGFHADKLRQRLTETASAGSKLIAQKLSLRGRCRMQETVPVR